MKLEWKIPDAPVLTQPGAHDYKLWPLVGTLNNENDMEDNNKSYFGGIRDGIKSLATGLRVTLREYFTPKVTEQYPENRKTTLHVAKRSRGRLVMKRDENDVVKCVACLMCEKACPNGTIRIVSEMVTNEEGKKKRQLVKYDYDLGDCMFL